jgi:hypothetical protein
VQFVNDVFTQLNEKNIQVNIMRNKINRLEELFVKLVANAQHKQAEPINEQTSAPMGAK